MSKKVRGHTAKLRQKDNEVAKAKVSGFQRPKTSLGFDRDSPKLLNFLENSPQGLEQEDLQCTSPRPPRKIVPLAKKLASFKKQEEKWRVIRYGSASYDPFRSSAERPAKYEGEGIVGQQKFETSSSTLHSGNQTQTSRTSSSTEPQKKTAQVRRHLKESRAKDGIRKNNNTKVRATHQTKTIAEQKQNPETLLRKTKSSGSSIFFSPPQPPPRNSLMSIDGLGSIIESEDNIRFIDDQISNYILLNGNPVSSVPVDDQLTFNDADEDYDTDLEEDFPEPPPKEYDPSETRTYLDKCKIQDIIPVKYVVERLGTRSLIMRHHGLGPNGLKPLARALFKNTFIEELDLTDNDIQAEGAILLSLTLYENLYITDLNLSENFIGVSGGISLATMLLKNTSLLKVSLKGNQFTDKVAKVFAEALKENRSLKYLDLSYNEFGEVGGLFLGAGLGANYGLETLNLSWNSIRNKGGVAMAASLRKNECLRSLDLSWNGLAFIGALAFARHLKKNDTLEELDISNNRIGTKGAQRVSLALKVNTGLQQFRMGLNPIGEDGIRAMITAIKQNISIKYLGLENITVSPKLHEEICQLEKEKDIVIRTGGQTGHTQNMPLPSGMEILVQFIQDNRMRVKELFFQFDKDQSGDITRDEFKAGLKECGIKMSETQLDTLIESIDIDNSNTIEYSEILYGRNVVLSDRRFQRKVKIRTERREKESIQLPKLQGFQE